MINGMAMKNKHIIIPLALQKQILDQFHNNHIGIEKMQLLVRESVYWINMNADTECSQAMCHMLGVPVNTAPQKEHCIIKYHAGHGK